MVQSLAEDGATRLRLRAALVPAGLCLVLAFAGCSGDDRPKPPEAAAVALKVTTVESTGRLSDATRTDLETAVGDVLSTYVVRAFLGTYPREDFVSAFGSFTIGTAQSATRDLDLLTASRFKEATSVRATDLDAKVSFLVRGRDVLGATARVRFGFDATMPDGATRPIVLQGRFMLVEKNDTWSVFGYDVQRDDGLGAETAQSS